MLVLSRKLNESIVIDGRIVVKVVRFDGDTVKLGIQAPMDIPVHRYEVYLEIQKNNQEALASGRLTLPRMGVDSEKTSKPAEPASPAKPGASNE
jgi:carbon storage regulator